MIRIVGGLGFGFLLAIGACVEDSNPPPTDFSVYAAESIGNVWVYNVRSYSFAGGVDRRFSGSRTVTLLGVDSTSESVSYKLSVRDSLKEIWKDAWGHKISVNQSDLRFTKTESGFTGDDAAFPLWYKRSGCTENPGQANMDGKAVQILVCTRDINAPREDWLYSSVALEGVGKIYTDSQTGGGGGDSSGYRYILDSFNGKKIPTVTLATVRKREFEDARYSSQDFDPSIFTPKWIGDKWAYKYVSGGRGVSSVDRMRFITLSGIDKSAHSLVFAFSVRDSLYLGDGSVPPVKILKDTVKPVSIGLDSNGASPIGPDGYLDNPLFGEKWQNAIFPRLGSIKVGEENLVILITGGKTTSGPQGAIYIQSIGMVFNGYCDCIGTNHASGSSLSLVAYNSLPINGDSLAHVFLGW